MGLIKARTNRKLPILFKHRHLATGIPFGIAVTIATVLPLSIGSGLTAWLLAIAAITFVVATTIAAFMQMRGESRLREQGISVEGAMPVRVQAILELRIPASTAHEICYRALRDAPLAHLHLTSHSPDMFEARSSWLSLEGQKLTIQIEKLLIDECRLVVQSVPRLSTLAVDWGRNYTNVMLVLKAIKAAVTEKSVIRERIVDLEAPT